MMLIDIKAACIDGHESPLSEIQVIILHLGRPSQCMIQQKVV